MTTSRRAPPDAWFGMACWNGLSFAQQRRLITWGNLPFGYGAEAASGGCDRGAQVSVETVDDEAPGPRFYCYRCAAEYLAGCVAGCAK